MQKFLMLLLSFYITNAVAETSLIIKYKPSTNESILINNKSMSTKDLNRSLRKPLTKDRIELLDKLLLSLDNLSKQHIKIIRDQPMAIGAHKLILNEDLDKKQQEDLLKLIKDKVPNLDYAEFDQLAYPN